MARSVKVIQNQLNNAVQADTNLYNPTNPDVTKQGLTSTSQVAKWNLWTFIVALCTALFEQVLDEYISDNEALIAAAPPNTPSWIRQKILQFQFDTTTPQVVQLLPDGTTGYPIVNPAFYVVDQCAVITTQNGKYTYKVALDGQPLTNDQMTALAAYLDNYNDAGIQGDGVTSLPDFVMVGALVKYNGQYDSVIQATVIAAISTFLQSIPFNGIFNISDLYVTIKAVPGVVDVTFNQVEIRANAVDPVDATVLVNAGDWQINEVGTFSGNATPDTASGRDLATTLTFQAA